jgi:YesN/AraC family two-component response regulator
MVCDRCIKAVEQILIQLDISFSHITLGQIVLPDAITADKLNLLSTKLKQDGFELIDNRKARIINTIKSTVINLVHHTKQEGKQNWSDVLTKALPYEYNYLSALFSSVEGITIEQYIIHQRIEKAKELIFYDELNLSEIAFRLGYSSVAHLSAQFKKVTGMSPSQLKKTMNPQKLRKALDDI